MMATQGNFDVLLGKLGAILEEYSNDQPISERFSVYTDYYRNLPANVDLANVFLYLMTMTPSGVRTNRQYVEYEVTYMIDLFVFAKGARNEGYDRADKAAGARLRILMQQILNALYTNSEPWLDMGIGVIGKKPFPTFTPMPPERMQQAGERAFAACRLTLPMTLSWEPDVLDGTNLEKISVTADLWSELIEPEQREES